MKYAAKKNETKKVRIGNIIKKKPNVTATILVILILAIVYCHFGEDLMVYAQAVNERNELARMAEQSVLFETGLDMDEIEVKKQEINKSIQNLKYGTDLGECFAENDLTAEGRKTNAITNSTIIVIAMVFAGYVFLNFIRFFWWAAVSGRKIAKNANFQSENIS